MGRGGAGRPRNVDQHHRRAGPRRGFLQQGLQRSLALASRGRVSLPGGMALVCEAGRCVGRRVRYPMGDLALRCPGAGGGGVSRFGVYIRAGLVAQPAARKAGVV